MNYDALISLLCDLKREAFLNEVTVMHGVCCTMY